MDLPVISIVTPSLNQGKYLDQCIDSVLSQDYPNLEYIIIDGGSRDESVDIIRKFSHRLSDWVSEPDSGQGEAIMKGLNKAKGSVFNWLNSDDYLEPGALKEIGMHFRDQPESNVYCGYCRLFWPDGREKKRRMGTSPSPEASIIDYSMNQPSTFYRMEIIRESRGISRDLHYCMDQEIWFRYLAKYGHQGIYFTDTLLSHFRHHELSKSEDGSGNFLKETNGMF